MSSTRNRMQHTITNLFNFSEKLMLDDHLNQKDSTDQFYRLVEEAVAPLGKRPGSILSYTNKRGGRRGLIITTRGYGALVIEITKNKPHKVIGLNFIFKVGFQYKIEHILTRNEVSDSQDLADLFEACVA